MAKNKKTRYINMKFIYFQVVTIIIIVTILGFASLAFTKDILINQLKVDVKHYGIMAGKYIEQNQTTNSIINKNIESLSLISSRRILTQQDKLSNSFLKDISKDFGADEIFYYSPTGKVLFSSTGELAGWQAMPGDPIYSFMQSGKEVFYEEIRKSIDNDNYLKFSYFRDKNGYFVQIGFLLDKIQLQTKKYDFQTIVNDISSDNKTYYSFITDRNLKEVADSNIDNVGIDWSKDKNYNKVLKGETLVVERYNKKLNKNILEVVVPMKSNGEITGTLVIGHKLDILESLVYSYSIRVLITLLFASLIIAYSQWKFVIKPINYLNEKLTLFEFSKKGNQLKVDKGDPFETVYITINLLLEKIDNFISKNTEIKTHMKYEAFHDELTSLKNRRALNEDLERVLNDNLKGSIFMIDLNNLKEINDIYGHIKGDDILRTFAKRICTLGDDKTEFYRFGGDEFIAIIIGDVSFVKKKYKSILKIINKPIESDGMDFDISCCLGISSFPEDGNSKDELIRKADIAMYFVKNNLGEGFAYFKPFMQDQLNEKSEINNKLKIAIKDEGFKLLYQPIIETNSQEISYFEALIRLKDSNISPNEFIKVAEEKGLIVEIGRYVIREAIKQLHEWKLKGIELKSIAINLSPYQINDNKLVMYILKLIEEYDVEAKYLEIEITEDIFIENSLEVVDFLDSLKSIGLRITLDDFGSGYSSLTYLTFMPIDKIKLDKVLIDKYLTIEKKSIIKNIINIAHDLKLLVVGEGIETLEQYEMLKAMKCDFIQGYYFSKPVDIEAIEIMLENEEEII